MIEWKKLSDELPQVGPNKQVKVLWWREIWGDFVLYGMYSEAFGEKKLWEKCSWLRGQDNSVMFYEKSMPTHWAYINYPT